MSLDTVKVPVLVRAAPLGCQYAKVSLSKTRPGGCLWARLIPAYFLVAEGHLTL